MSEPASDSPGPPVTGEIREQARQSPGSWIYSVDSRFDPDGAVPGHAIIGAWPVDAAGELGAFVPNPRYRPRPDPTDEVEAAMRQAVAGQASQAEFFDTLVGSTVYLPATADGELIAYRDGNGEYVAVLTDPHQAPPGVAQLVPAGFADLLHTLPTGTALWINPGGDVSLGASSTDLLAALRERTTPDVPDQLPEIPRKGSIPGA